MDRCNANQRYYFVFTFLFLDDINMVRVNIADAMQFWTSQSLKSTTHRVQIPPRQRFSIAYFVQPDPETVTFRS